MCALKLFSKNELVIDIQLQLKSNLLFMFYRFRKTMSLLKKISKDIDASILEFCKEIALQYDIDQDDLLNLWEKTNQNSTKKPKKRTAYQNFSSLIRNDVCEENPDFTFGEISKEIGKRWKLLSASQKKKYEIAEESVVSAKNYKNLKVAQLKDLCKSKGLDYDGKKAELVQRLMENDHSPADPTILTPIGGSPLLVESPISGSPLLVESPVIHSPALSMGSISSISSQGTESAESPVMNYKEMKVAELKKICKDKGFDIKGKNKVDLIELLSQNISG